MSLNQQLIDAATNGQLDLIKNLIEQGVDLHVESEAALRSAANYGHLDVVKYLVDRGADIHVKNEYPLRWAANNGRLGVVKYLVEQGADIHVDDEEALRWAAINVQLEVVKYLVEQGANPEVILDNPKDHIPYVVDFTKARSITKEINIQIEYAPLGRFKSFPQGGVKYQENSYRLLWTRICQEIGNAPPGHLKLLPFGSSGYQETKEWIEKEYPENE